MFVVISFVECVLVMVVKLLFVNDCLCEIDDDDGGLYLLYFELLFVVVVFDDGLLCCVVDVLFDVIVGIDVVCWIISWNLVVVSIFGIDMV